MYCINCGKKLNDNELYCTECGTKNEIVNNKKKKETDDNFLLDEKLEDSKVESVSSNDADSSTDKGIVDDSTKSDAISNNSSNSNVSNKSLNNNRNNNEWPKKLIIALVFGLIAMFTGPIFSIITLVLAIVGLIFALKCSDVGSTCVGVVIVNVLGILSSLFGIFLAFCVVLALVFPEESTNSGVKHNDPPYDYDIEDKTSYIENTWYCGVNSNVDSSNYSLVMDFNDGKFEWKNSTSSAYIRGSYDIVKANYGVYKHRLNYYVEDASMSTSSSSYYYIDIDEDKLQLYSSGSYKTYYCTTELGSQNQL